VHLKLHSLKRTRRDEPIGALIHICMETTQENSLCSYLYLKLAKMSCFPFYLLCFFLYKIREQEGGTGSAWWGEREVAGKQVGD
jgi:hypothetical protein